MQPLAIGFDFDHTLGIDNKLEVVAFVQVAQQIAASIGRAFDGERARVAIGQQLERYRSGRSTLDDAVRRAYDDTLDEGIADAGHVAAFRARAVELAPQFVQALPGVAELMGTLDASSIRYAILTNGWNPLQSVKADCIGFRKRVFVSDDLGVRKPSVQAFDVLCGYFELPAAQSWYVGDDPKMDILGALSAGMRAIWFDWENKKYPTDIPGPTAIVKHIQDVLDYIT